MHEKLIRMLVCEDCSKRLFYFNKPQRKKGRKKIRIFNSTEIFDCL